MSRDRWAWLRHLWMAWHRLHGRAVYRVLITECIVWERRIAAVDEGEARLRASHHLARRRVQGWQQGPRYMRDLRALADSGRNP
jgi:hypothetical protein